MEWKTIDSVPREGAEFMNAPEVLLCWCYPDSGPIIRIGRFFTETWKDKILRFKLEIDYGDAGATVFTATDDQPTHWMPLPPAPSVT
jgi:hypothetical protein